MYIGSLLNENAETNITYTYKKRGLDIPYYPDYISEAEEKDKYSLCDKLFTDCIGFDGTALLDRGIDIHIDLGRECFVDSLVFNQGAESELGLVKVLVPNGNSLRAVGNLMPHTDKTITDSRVRVLVGVHTSKLILRINALYKHIVIGSLNIFGAVNIGDAVYPLPAEISYDKGFYSGDFAVCACGDDAAFAAEDFVEKLGEIIAFDFGESPLWNNKKATVTSDKTSVEFALADLEKEEYHLNVTTDSITLKGGSRRALIYGAARLLQLVSKDGIKCCQIKDQPFMQIRGVHLALPDRDKIDFFKRIVRYMIAPLGFNNIYIQLSATMEYKSHPEINRVWADACDKYHKGEYPLPPHYDFVSHDILTHEEVKDICAYIRSFGLEIIPEVQSFGHTQYLTMSHPELAEIDSDEEQAVDLFVADITPGKFYKHCMCPNHPDYYKLIFDVIDEVIEVVQPEKYLHIGHDEIYVVGKCERCKNIPDDEIYATEVTKLNDHIKSKGLTTMMWSDMIQEQNYTTAPAISKIPKDIICQCFTWYFHLDENIENMLYDNGFKVMFGNFYSSHFPRLNQRKHHPDFLGAQTSTWVNIYEDILAFKGKTYDIVADANMFWSSEYFEDCPYTYTLLADKYLQYARRNISESIINGKTISADFEKTSASVPCDILNDYKEAMMVQPGKNAQIELNCKCKKIAFVQATDVGGDHIVWKKPSPLADYTINYTDGTSHAHTIGYGVGIVEYKRRYAKPIESDLYRHEGYVGTGMITPHIGKTIDGFDYCVSEYTIPNPEPEKEIAYITLSHRGTMDASIILFDIKIQQ